MERRAWRERLVAEGSVRLDFELRGRDKLTNTLAAREYLRAANLRFTDLEDSDALRARLALFPALTFGHVLSPAAHLHWPRDPESRDRMAVVICRSGILSMTSSGPLHRRSGRLVLGYVVPPGDKPIDIALGALSNELAYISMPATFAKALRIDETSASDGSVSDETLAPFLLFLMRMCSITVDDRGGASTLAVSAEEVARALTRVFLGAPDQTRTLFTRCIDVMLAEYADSKLMIDAVAERMSVSVRTVQLAFQARGTTFGRELREIRARAARTLWRVDSTASRRDIAAASGFGSTAALDRALAAGRSPKP